MVGVGRHGPAERKARHLLRCGAAKLGRFGRDDCGTVVVLAGIILPVLVGGMGLGAEAGYWYWTQRKVQHAADVAVYAAAVRLSQGDDETDYEKAALQVAEEAGYLGGESGIQVHSPPQAPSTNAGEPDHVQVILTESVARLLTSMFIDSDLALTGHAVASVEYGSSGCVLALSKTKSKAVQMSGSTNVELEDCDVASNSTAADAFNMQGSARLTTGCVHSAGGVSATQNMTLTDEIEGDGPCKNGPRENAPNIADPYASVPNPSPDGLPCDNKKNVSSPNQTNEIVPTHSHSSGMMAKRYCNGADVKGETTFKPGVYFIEGGDFTINSTAEVSGEGVTFVLMDGAELSFNGGASIDLSAPEPDPDNPDNPFEGILFFSDRNDSTATHKINGDASSTLNGAIYAPTSDIQYAGGGSTTGGCTQVIGDTVEFTGNSSVGSNCSGTGVRDMQFGQQIAIVE